MNETNWWHNSINYCLYIRSFFDSNNDGYGDLEGVEQKLDYLKWLGISCIWITPFYPTPDFDCGYDVIDYYEIDQRFGNWDIFQRLLEKIHKMDMKLMMDIVPNHTSHEHEWFKQAISDPNSEFRDYYIFKDPKPDGSLPNNWLSHFGGPAWTLDQNSGQYYLHLFLKEQPDLNWRNPKVHEEFIKIVEFWVKKGVDGFRIDITQGCYKQKDFLDQPWLIEDRSNLDCMALFESQKQIYALAQPETPKIFIDWKKAATKINPEFKLMGEYGEINLKSGEHYFYENNQVVKGFDTMAYTLPYKLGWDYPKWFEMLSEYSDLNLDQKIAWSIDSSERSRSITRFGGGEIGLKRSKAMALLCLLLPGFPIIYMGQELGLEDIFIEKNDVKDCISLNDMEQFEAGRDKVRTHMSFLKDAKWNGFSEADDIWLNSKNKLNELTVEYQVNQEDSTLNFYKDLLSVRNNIEYLGSEKVLIEEIDSKIMKISFNNYIIICNMSNQNYELNLDAKILFSSQKSVDQNILDSDSSALFMV